MSDSKGHGRHKSKSKQDVLNTFADFDRDTDNYNILSVAFSGYPKNRDVYEDFREQFIYHLDDFGKTEEKEEEGSRNKRRLIFDVRELEVSGCVSYLFEFMGGLKDVKENLASSGGTAVLTSEIQKGFVDTALKLFSSGAPVRTFLDDEQAVEWIYHRNPGKHME